MKWQVWSCCIRHRKIQWRSTSTTPRSISLSPKRFPGLRRYEISRGPVGAPGEVSGVHLVATLVFDSMAAIQSGLGSPEGQAAAGDVPNFATGGADMLMFDSKEA